MRGEPQEAMVDALLEEVEMLKQEQELDRPAGR